MRTAVISKRFQTDSCRSPVLGTLVAGLFLLAIHGGAGAASVRDQVLSAAPGLEQVVFAVRKPVDDPHWYANFGYYGPDEHRVAFKNGGMLCVLSLASGEVTTLIDDPDGGIRDPVVSHDAERIVFSWRKGGGMHHHLWECRIDGSGLRQLTDGPWDDIEPCILPDDSIVFVSTRCKRWVNCWLTQVATLHRCDRDGGNIEMISANIEHDNTPWPLPDGRILYQRWEYIDRSQVDYHHLWTTNPDGSGQMVFYGNLKPGIVMIDAKPVPSGNGGVIAIFSPGHGQREHAGSVAILHPRHGPDDPQAARTITADGGYRDPWALAPGAYLVARDHEMLALDDTGAVEVIHALSGEARTEGFMLHEPRPVMKRPREKHLPSRVTASETTGRLILADILEGRNMDGVNPGEIRKLLVMEPLPKPINFTGGMDPLSYGGSFTLERVVGTVPVEADGSAYIELPARRNFFFVALDKDNLAVKRMQSFVTVQPGETTSCVGCHEQRTRTTLKTDYLMALDRAPSAPEPVAGIPEVFDFPRDIQPILDSACVPCHGYDATPSGGPFAGGVVLTGDHGPMFSHSYFTLTTRQLFSDGRNRAKSNYAPRTLGSSASRLVSLADGSHHGARIQQIDMDKLRLWIDAAATYPGTYAALGTGMIGGYVENQQTETDDEWPTTRAAASVIRHRCLPCHDGSQDGQPLIPLSLSDERGMSFWMPRIPDPAHRTSRHLIFNLSRPAKSLLLLAPLAKEAGGFGICSKSSGEPVLQQTTDPDYTTLLGMLEAGRTRLQQITRFDIPGFKPHPAYIREMKRYGAIPPNHQAGAPLDPYRADTRYWRSLWHPPSPSN